MELCRVLGSPYKFGKESQIEGYQQSLKRISQWIGGSLLEVSEKQENWQGQTICLKPKFARTSNWPSSLRLENAAQQPLPSVATTTETDTHTQKWTLQPGLNKLTATSGVCAAMSWSLALGSPGKWPFVRSVQQTILLKTSIGNSIIDYGYTFVMTKQ